MELLKGGIAEGPRLSNLAVKKMKCTCGSTTFDMTMPVEIMYNCLDPEQHQPNICAPHSTYDCKGCGKRAGFKIENGNVVGWVFLSKEEIDAESKKTLEAMAESKVLVAEEDKSLKRNADGIVEL